MYEMVRSSRFCGDRAQSNLTPDAISVAVDRLEFVDL
jgi:hypothetical protein